MEHTKRNRLLPFLMAAAMVFTLLALPARASQFSDIADPEVSMAADVLSALGVVNGTGSGRFSPNGQLTRVQFCKMAIEIMGRGELAEGQKYRTIFNDVKSTHWGRGYVNLAATMDLGNGVYLMRGTGNGSFAPDRSITYQEAVTTLLRVLGYGEEAERYWPNGAIQTAASLGLDKGLNVKDPAKAITRGQAALLFYRMLSVSPKGSEQTFLQAQGLGRQVDDVIVLSVAAGNGVQTLVTTEGEYPAAVPVDQSLAGQRGSVLLDGKGRFIAMLTGETSTLSFTVSRRQGSVLFDADGGQHTVQSSSLVYTDLAEAPAAYEGYQENIHAGDSVTLYLDAKGQVVCMLHRASSVLSSFVIVRGSASASMFASLTGTERSYTILKNGRPAAMSDLGDYDVVTYDPASKILYACDVRLRCVYEGASPSPASPTGHIVAAAGHEFTVLDDAVDSFADQKIGSTLILMLTYDGKVAGLYPTRSADSNNALGILSGNEFQLLNCKLALDASSASISGSRDRLFTASSSRRDVLTLTAASTQTTNTFNKTKMTLSNLTVVPQPIVYEQTSSGLRLVELADVPDSAAVSQYHRNSAGQVDVLILSPFSGDGVEYGRIDFSYEDRDGSRVQHMWFSTAGGASASYETIGNLSASSRFGSFTVAPRYSYIDGQVGASAEEVVSSIQPLQAVSGVPSSAFYTADGKTYVRTSQGVFQVADDVQCYNAAASGTTASGAPRAVWFKDLAECRNYSDTVTIYLDTLGQKVRIVSVQ